MAKMKKHYFILLILTFGFALTKAQVTLVVNNTSLGNPGSADVILAQAQGLVNAGQTVTVNLNASGIIPLYNYALNLTNGHLIIQKDPNATIPQGFGDSNPSNYNFAQCLGLLMNFSSNLTIQNIEFHGAYQPVVINGGNNVSVLNCQFNRYGTALTLVENPLFTSNAATNNILVQNCVFSKYPLPPSQNIFYAYYAIQRENENNNTNSKSIQILNNDFKNNDGINIATRSNIDNTMLTVKNNTGSNKDGMVATIGDSWSFYQLQNNGNIINNHKYNDYLFGLDFENNDVRGIFLINPLNHWRIENNNFKYDYTNSSPNVPYNSPTGPFIVITPYIHDVWSGISNAFTINNPITQTRDYKIGFYNNTLNSCNNQSFSNANNPEIINPSNSTTPWYSMVIEGNKAKACAVTEITGQDIKGTIQIFNNVSVRNNKITVTASSFTNPIVSNSPAQASICSTTINASGNLEVRYNYIGIPPSKGNDLYVDFYKSNSNGDLLDYLGQEVFLNANIGHSSFATIPVPSSVTLNSTDRIALTITGLAASSNYSAVGTSKAFYSPPVNCISGGFVGYVPSQSIISFLPHANSAITPCLPPPSPPFPPQPDWNWTGGCWLQCGIGGNYYTATICKGQSFQFNAGASSVAGVTYSWDFGDNTSILTGTNVSHVYSNIGSYVVNVTVSGSNCTPVTEPVYVTVVDCSCSGAKITGLPGKGCINTAINMSIGGCQNPGATYNWSFGDGSTGTGINASHSYSSPGNYNVICTITMPGYPTVVATALITIEVCTQVAPCTDCIGTFQPEAGDYIVSLWVREDVNPQPQTYNNPKVEISFNGSSALYTFGTNSSKNKIIEGWQRIEEQFNIPVAATDINIKLLNSSSTIDAYFDDIRIFPKDGQMKTYVYDPITLRLTATLDENNYATFYEYDEEGKLIRVKKETEKGIMTIQESREAVKKK